MEALKTRPRRRKLTLDRLVVEGFHTTPEDAGPSLAGITINDSHCPTHFDSECPCCTGAWLCPPGGILIDRP